MSPLLRSVVSVRVALRNSVGSRLLAPTLIFLPILAEAGADGITEEQRLAALVAAVDDSCAVAPKGALLLDARHRVVQSPSFKGLTADQAMDLKSYVHWRAPQQPDKIKIRETKGLTQTTDFLDTIHADEPAVSLA